MIKKQIENLEMMGYTWKEDGGSETPGRSRRRPGPGGDDGCGVGVNLQDRAVGLRSGRVRLRRRGIRGLTVLERVAIDGGGVVEEGREHCHRGPVRVRGNPSHAGLNLQDDELGLRGGQVRGRRHGIRGLSCWTKAPSMEAGSGK